MKPVKVVLVLVAFGVIIAAAWFCASRFSFCYATEDTVQKRLASPDGKYTATVFERDCGATTDYSTMVNIQEGHLKRFNGDSGVVLVIKGRTSVKLTWQDATSLVISCSSSEVFRKETKWKDVVIHYDP